MHGDDLLRSNHQFEPATEENAIVGDFGVQLGTEQEPYYVSGELTVSGPVVEVLLAC
jgi:hypothetical protein